MVVVKGQRRVNLAQAEVRKLLVELFGIPTLCLMGCNRNTQLETRALDDRVPRSLMTICG